MDPNTQGFKSIGFDIPLYASLVVARSLFPTTTRTDVICCCICHTARRQQHKYKKLSFSGISQVLQLSR